MNKPDDRLLEEIKSIARSMLTASHYNNLPEDALEDYLKEIIAKTSSIKDAEITKLQEESEARHELIRRLTKRALEKDAEHQQKIAEILDFFRSKTVEGGTYSSEGLTLMFVMTKENWENFQSRIENPLPKGRTWR